MDPSFQDYPEEPFSYEDGPIVFQLSRQGICRKEVRGVSRDAGRVREVRQQKTLGKKMCANKC